MRIITLDTNITDAFKYLMIWSVYFSLLQAKGIKRATEDDVDSQYCMIGSIGRQRLYHFQSITDFLNLSVEAFLRINLSRSFTYPGHSTIRRLLARFHELENILDAGGRLRNPDDLDLHDILRLLFTELFPSPPTVSDLRGYSARAWYLVHGNTTWKDMTRFLKHCCHLNVVAK
jgi:hypothetical protein